jgi:hypothetical protein
MHALLKYDNKLNLKQKVKFNATVADDKSIGRFLLVVV